MADGRNKNKKAVHAIARGRVWTGSDARNRGLVDQLGGLMKAIKDMQRSCGVKESVFYPKKQTNTFDTLLALLDEEFENEEAHTRASIPTDFLRFYEKFAKIHQMKGMQMRLPFILDIH